MNKIMNPTIDMLLSLPVMNFLVIPLIILLIDAI